MFKSCNSVFYCNAILINRHYYPHYYYYYNLRASWGLQLHRFAHLIMQSVNLTRQNNTEAGKLNCFGLIKGTSLLRH